MSFRRLQWLFPVVVTLHNLEEGLTYGDFLKQHSRELPWALEPTTFAFAAVVLTIAAWGLTFLSWQRGAESVPAYCLFGFTGAMLANVVIPHVPLAVALDTYNPGLVTAVISLPVLTFLLIRALREEYVKGSRAATFAMLVPLGIAASAIALWLATKHGGN